MNESLSDAELASLREVARGGLMQRRIPDAHRKKLLALGLIDTLLGGLGVTPAGKKLLSAGPLRRGG